jgi:nicotinate phosphoribosyltransferase
MRTACAPAPGIALHTDLYELTMLDAALGSGVAGHRAVFELFPRRLPAGRRFGVVAGTGRFLDALEHFRFGPTERDLLAATGRLSPEALDHLMAWRFTGSVDGYAEGEIYTAGSPVLTVEATFAEAVVLETLALSILNFDSAVAAAGARIRHAAGPRIVMDAGTRRADPDAAVAAARAAWIAGIDATSNVAAACWGVPVIGTAAHSLTLAHTDELSAFRAQVARDGPATSFLVDTYDIAAGIANALEASGGGLARIRIDSGDLGEEARRARHQLDAAGATAAQIVASGDLDEFRIADLVASGAPVDAFQVGTSLVGGSGHPSAGFVYKLVAVADRPGADAPLRPVQKRSAGKANDGGRKVAVRHHDDAGRASHDEVTTGVPGAGRPLQRRLVEGGARIDRTTAAAAREHHAAAVAELRPQDRDLAPGPPALLPPH